MNCKVGRIFSCVVLFFTVFVFINGADKKIESVELYGGSDIWSSSRIGKFIKKGELYYNDDVEVNDKIKEIRDNGYVVYHNVLYKDKGNTYKKVITFVKKQYFDVYNNDTKYDNFVVLRYTKKCKFGDLRKELLDNGICLYVDSGLNVTIIDEGEGGEFNLGYFANSTGNGAYNEGDIEFFIYTRDLCERDESGYCQHQDITQFNNIVEKAVKDFNTPVVVKPKPKPKPAIIKPKSNPPVAPKPVNGGSSSGSNSPKKKKKCCCCC